MDIKTIAQARVAIEELKEEIEQLKEQIEALRKAQSGPELVARIRNAGVMPRMA